MTSMDQEKLFEFDEEPSESEEQPEHSLLVGICCGVQATSAK